MTRRRTPVLVIAALSLPLAGGVPDAVRADAPPDVPARPSAKPQTARPATRPAATRGAAPTTRPAKELSAEEMLSQMLKPAERTGNRPLAPLPEAAGGGPDRTSGAGAVAPAAPVVNVLREGTFLVDRIGRLNRTRDGSQAEFTFESDGTSLQDPPVVILPNLKLMQMENAVSGGAKDLKFKVTGLVTEYKGRNYILLEKVVVVPDIVQQF